MKGSKPGARDASPTPHDRLARWAVGAVWAAMVLAPLAAVVLIARDVPLAEDWLLVRPLTGHEPDLLEWLWAQNNEHRVPFPRLILLALLALSGGDFRAGMVFDILAIGAVAGAMILAARRLRGGRTRLTDAFFPIALLHLGHWENLLWSWQLSQVVPTLLACVLLLVFVVERDLKAPRPAAIVGVCLLLLPLCGANGLVFVPLPALWLSYSVLTGPRVAPPWVRPAALGTAALSLALCAAYFVGYERPTWQPENPGLYPSLVAAVQFATFGLGPAVQRAWVPAAVFALGLMGASGVIAGLAAWRSDPGERRRALALLLFLANMAAYVGAVGWGRAGVLEVYGQWPLRYGLMAAPAFCAAYFTWLLYGPARLRRVVHGVLLLAVLALTPLNTRAGLAWGRWYHGGMLAVERDLAAGASAEELAHRHGDFLVHWWSAEDLADAMRMLRDAEISLFERMAPDAPTDAAALE